MISRFLAITALLAFAASPAAADPLPRQPTGKWLVDFADDLCVLQREYGTADKPLTLSFRPSPMSQQLAIYIFDEPARKPAAIVPVKIGIGPGLEPVESMLETFDPAGETFRYNSTGIARADLERAAGHGAVSFKARDRIDAAFAIPELSKALAVLDECVVDLLDTWGFSRAQQQAMAKPPEPVKPASEYVSPGDYPRDAIRRNEMGVNSVRFRVGTDGMPSDCQIVEASKSRALDSTICRVAMRMRFHPAVDKAGQPMDSLMYIRMRWLMR